MFTPKVASAIAGVALAISCGIGAHAQAVHDHYSFGSPVADGELAKYFSIPPDGRGLPPGSGTSAAGAKIFAENCAACHGEKLQGIPAANGDRLIGGRATLATNAPIRTVESYWPYATTLFDYIKRAMPFSSPGSLSDPEVYALVAYILSEAKVIKSTDTMNAKTLPKVQMPNKDGFMPDPRPELQLYR